MPASNSLDPLIAKLKMLNQLDEGDLSSKEILSQWIASLKASAVKKGGGSQLSLKGPGAGLSGGSVSQDLSILSIANEWLKNIAQNVEKIAARIGVAAPAPAAQVADTIAATKTSTAATKSSTRPASSTEPSAPDAALPLSGVLKLVLLMKPIKTLAGLGLDTEKGLVSLGRGLLSIGKPIAMIGGVIENFGVKNVLVLRMLLSSLSKMSVGEEALTNMKQFGAALQTLAEPILMIGLVISNFGKKNVLALRMLLSSLSEMSGMDKRTMTKMKQFGEALKTLAEPIATIGSVIENFGKKNVLALQMLLSTLSEMSGMDKRTMTKMKQFGAALQTLAEPIATIGSVIANFGKKNVLALQMLLRSLSEMSGMDKETMTNMKRFGKALQTLAVPIKEIGSVIANFGKKNVLALHMLLNNLVTIGKNSKGVKDGLVELGEGLGEVGKHLKSIIDPITNLFNSLLKGAIAVVVFAGGIYLMAKAIATFADIEWGTVGKALLVMGGLALMAMALSTFSGQMIMGAAALVVLAGAIWVSAEALQHFAGIDWANVAIGSVAIAAMAAAVLFASPLLLGAGVALLAFGVGLLATAVALQTLGDSTDSLKKLTEIDAENLWSVSKAIGAIGVAMAALGAGQAVAGIGSLFSRIVTVGSDSPVEQMEKMSKMGPGLVQAADGFSRIPDAIKHFAEADMEKGLNAVEKVARVAKLFPQPTAAERPNVESLTPTPPQSEKAGPTVFNAPTNNSSTNMVNNNSSMVMPAPPPRNSEPTMNYSLFRSLAPA